MQSMKQFEHYIGGASVKPAGVTGEWGAEAIREYLRTKCVWIRTVVRVANPSIRR
jgi:acyl-CoA reductase-like NAD-dependent aldehyde dehydrogenase